MNINTNPIDQLYCQLYENHFHRLNLILYRRHSECQYFGRNIVAIGMHS